MPIFEFLIGSGGTALLTWIRERYGDSIKESISTGFQKLNWHTAQINYLTKIEQDYGEIRLFGTDEPIRLDEIFTDVYLLNNSEAFEYHLLRDTFGDIPKEMEKRFSGLEYVKEGHKFVYIVGKPGAGKTTFLKHIALKAAQNEIKKIPVFIELKTWARSGKDLISYIAKEFDICNFPDAQLLIDYLLDMGRMVVLLDGLDEVSESNQTRSSLIAEIKDFSRKYPNNQFLLTCRIAATDYTFEKFKYLRVADFTKEQITIYIENWFAKKSEEKLNKFKEAIFDAKNSRFLEMASQPLLLSLLCINFNETMSFSERRTDIYEEAISVLIDKWSASKDVIHDDIFNFPKARKMQMFAEIAAENFGREKDFDRFGKKEFVSPILSFVRKLPNISPNDELDGEKIIRSIETNNSILVERYKNVFSFGHLSFQEYFVARYAVANNRIESLLTYINIIQDKWSEVILNAASLLDDADIFFQIFEKSLLEIIKDDSEITKILQIAATKAKEAPFEKDQLAVYMFYLYLLIGQGINFAHSYSLAFIRSQEFDRDRIRKRIKPNVESPTALALKREQVKVAVIDRILDFIYDVADNSVIEQALKHLQFFHLDRTLYTDGALSVAREVSAQAVTKAFYFNGNLDNEINLDYQIYIISKVISLLKVRHFPQNAYEIRNGLQNSFQLVLDEGNKLSPSINSLTSSIFLPEGNLTIDVITNFESKFNELRQSRQLDLGIELTIEQLVRIGNYIAGINLLIASLGLASVSNREEIKSRIITTVK